MSSSLVSEHGTLPLAPIDRPASLFVRLLYWLTRRRYGLTPTAFRIVYARSPFMAVLSVLIIVALERFLKLDKELARLLSLSVAMRHGCTFCADLHRAEGIRQRIGAEKLRDLLAFDNSQVFTRREKAALAYGRAVFESLHISDAIWAELDACFSERERLDIVWVCAVERYYNSLAVPLRIGSDGLAARA